MEKEPTEPSVLSEPTIEELKAAISENFDVDTLNELEGLDLQTALGYCCTLLETIGEDPIAFFMEKGIIIN